MNWGVEVLQTFALPLGYDAVFVLRLNSIPKLFSFVKGLEDFFKKTAFLLCGNANFENIAAISWQLFDILY